MAAASPHLLTVEEAAAIARCSVKTVRRAYATGALIAYRRRGSRAVLLDNRDVLAWVHSEILQPTAPTPRSESAATRPQTRKEVRPARAGALGSQQRFDLSVDALRDRRDSQRASRA
jgi:excisionase family DNA binding protein